MRVLLRFLKGLFLGHMFLWYGLGILVECFLVLPVIRLSECFTGPVPGRMQAFHRVLMSLFLWGLKVGRLLVPLPPKGEAVAGPCVVVANHPGLFDVVVMIREIPAMSVMVKRSLARKTPLGPVLSSSGYVLSPDYSDAASALASLKQASGVLKAGLKFQLFPEGTRSPAGQLRRFRSGAFKIARLAGVPVQPVLIRNVPPFLTRADHWYLPPLECATVRMEFLEPLEPPKPGQEGAMARQLEAHYRRLLALDDCQSPSPLVELTTPRTDERPAGRNEATGKGEKHEQ